MSDPTGRASEERFPLLTIRQTVKFVGQKNMLERLEEIEARYEELTNQISSPELLANPSAYGKAAKQHRSLGEMVDKYRQWKSLKEELAGARELLETGEDEEMRQMA